MRRPKIMQAPDGTLYVSESACQISCVKWFRTVYKSFALYLWSIPNGGKRGGKTNKHGQSIEAAIMKAEGLTSGVADLMLSLARSGLHGLYIEMKTPVGQWDKDQRAFAERQIAEGYGYALCPTQNDFEKAVTLYMQNKYVQAPIEKIGKKQQGKFIAYIAD